MKGSPWYPAVYAIDLATYPQAWSIAVPDAATHERRRWRFGWASRPAGNSHGPRCANPVDAVFDWDYIFAGDSESAFIPRRLEAAHQIRESARSRTLGSDSR